MTADGLVEEALRSRGVLVDNEIEALAKAGAIDPFNPAMLSGCSYDLRVGKVLRSRNRKRALDLTLEEYFIESGECVTIETLESVNFRDSLLFAFVVNKHSVLARGLVHPITKIDPGFSGPLAITVFNHGNEPETIRFKEPFVSVVIFPVGAKPSRIYGVTQQPSNLPGSLNIASLVNATDEPRTDARLASMYGRPVARLYEIVEDLRKSIDAGLVTQGKKKRAIWVDLAWRFVVALFGGAVALIGKAILDNWPGS